MWTQYLLQSVSSSGTSTPRRSTPRKVASSSRMTHQVLFTGISDTKQESIVRQLGMKNAALVFIGRKCK